MPDGTMAGSVRRWLGVGSGRGIDLLFLLPGLLYLLVIVVGLAHRRLRLLEDELSDHHLVVHAA